jgi:hypothetical protein
LSDTKPINSYHMPRSVSGQTTLPFTHDADEHLDVSTLETWLWDAACAIRGAADAPKFKDFILPLVFYKRLSDVFDNEFAGQIEAYGDEKLASEIIEADHADALKTGRKPIVRFYIPRQYCWDAIRNHPADGTLGDSLTTSGTISKQRPCALNFTRPCVPWCRSDIDRCDQYPAQVTARMKAGTATPNGNASAAQWYDADELKWAVRHWAARIGVAVPQIRLRHSASW